MFVHLTEKYDYEIIATGSTFDLLKENNITFDKYYWKQSDKLDVSMSEKLDFMIDDDYKIIEKIASNGIKCLYFRDTNLKKIQEGEYIREVNNWGDIYRIIKNEIEKD